MAKEKKGKKAEGVKSFPANKKGLHKSRLMNFFRVLFYPIHAIVYPFKRYGHKKAGKGALIYIGNHYCLWDVFYVAHSTWEGVHFMAKDSILRAPVLGKMAKKCGVIGAMRDGSDVRTLMDSIRLLKNGEKISLFPEGTRNKVSDEEFLPFHGGAALLSIKTKTPIQPFVVCNRPRVFRRTHVVFGEPFEFTEYYDKRLTSEDYEEADKKLQDILYGLRSEWRENRKKKKCKK